MRVVTRCLAGFVMACWFGVCPVESLRGQEKPTPDTPDGSDAIRQLKKHGSDLMAAGRFAEAIPVWSDVVAATRRLYPPSDHPQGHTALADVLCELAKANRDAGKFETARKHFEESLAMLRRLYPAEKHPDGNAQLAEVLGHFASGEHRAGRNAQALELIRDALTMQRKLLARGLLPRGKRALADSLTQLGLIQQEVGRFDEAAKSVDEAIAIQRAIFVAPDYPDGHVELVTSLATRGLIEHGRGQLLQGLPYFEEALEGSRKLYSAAKFPKGHPNLATAINNVAAIQQLLGRLAFARPLHEESLAMRRASYPTEKYPDGHPDLLQSLNNLSTMCMDMRDLARAITYGEQAVAMARKLFPPDRYPQGHPAFANALANYSIALQEAKQFRPALSPIEEALAQYTKIYPADKFPQGHPDLARLHFSVAVTYRSLGEAERGLAFLQRALAMDRQLFPPSKFPNGHHKVAATLNGLGYVLTALGRHEEALEYHRESLAMREKLYLTPRFPNGHPDLAAGYGNIAVSCMMLKRFGEAREWSEKLERLQEKLYPKQHFPNGTLEMAQGLHHRAKIEWEMGSLEKALPYFERAAEMQSRWFQANGELMSENAALTLLNYSSVVQDGYLLATREGRVPPLRAYAQLWNRKAQATRILERRHTAARLVQLNDANLARSWKELGELRAEIARTINLPSPNYVVRSAYLKDLSQRRDQLERLLQNALPAEAIAVGGAATSPEKLRAVLPVDAAYIDCILYRDHRMGNRLCYAMFLLTRDQPIQRVDIVDAKGLHQAIAEWLNAITDGKVEDGRAVRDRLWQPLQAKLPAGIRTLYISGDAELQYLPWGALPSVDGGVLLEKYGFAQVPHGSFLQTELSRPGRDLQNAKVLLAGDLSYNSPTWPALPGSKREIESIKRLLPADSVVMSGAEVTSARLASTLTGREIAHFATHGYFDSSRLEEERRRLNENAQRLIGLSGRAFDGDAVIDSRLAYSGLVLSNSELFTGEGVVNLALDRLALCVLSACETGQGSFWTSEGVFGLTRAFHLAGCSNVVASLWRVNDDATAALMVKFYHELMVNRKPPIEALREAQLMVYRHPELIPALTGERGGPRLKEAVSTSTVRVNDPNHQHAPTKRWAAFILSGAGR